MNMEEAQKHGEVAMDRDPRKAPFGFFSGGSFVLDSARVFSWFENMDELVTFLLEVEPRIYDIEDLSELAAYQAKVSPLLDRLKANGFSEGLRQEVNAAVSEFTVIDWWGKFSEITDGKTDFSRNLIENFVDPDEGQELQVAPDQMDDFVDYLKTCGC
jgi:hypothetical protein